MIKFVLSLAGLFILTACSDKRSTHGKADAYKASAVDERTFMDIGGTQQYVEIRGESDSLPVLLFIHGGPGWPQTPQLRYFNADLCKSFIVATWDQRGCGLSLMKDSTVQNVSLQQIVADAHQLTQFLKEKFRQPQVYLAGFSWGSNIGIRLAQQYPGDYKAYVGISQIVNIEKGMQRTQQWLQQQATNTNDTATLSALKKLDKKSFCHTPMECFMKQYELVSKYRGAVYDSASDKETAKAMAMYDDYKTYDWNKGFFYSAQRMEKDAFAADLSFIKKLDMPVYFISGRHDWNVPAVLVQEFMEQLEAPYKEMIWFENSAHGPLEEEPAKFNKVMAEKLLQPKDQ